MTDLQDIEIWINKEQRSIDMLLGEARRVSEEGKHLQASVEDLTTKIDTIDKAIAVLQSFGDQRQQELQSKIEKLVTHGLQSIFGSDLSFEIRQTTRGKLAAMDFLIVSTVDGERIETSILDSRGGGVAAVAGFLIRLVILLLSVRRADPLLILDESFAQLSEDYTPKLAEFLKELTDKTRVQIILITHSQSYSEYADKTYRFSLNSKGHTVITNE